VSEFKGLNADGVREYLSAKGIEQHVVELLHENGLDGDSLYNAKYKTLKEIDLKFNDYVKIRNNATDPLIKPSNNPTDPRVPMEVSDFKGPNADGDQKSREPETFRSPVALVISNNYPDKKALQLRNLRHDVDNIKHVLKSLRFHVVPWGEDETPEDFYRKLGEFYDKCLKTDIGLVFVFYYGHGGRSDGRDGMIFNNLTHVPLRIVEHKLVLLNQHRHTKCALFFNACRNDIPGGVTDFRPEGKGSMLELGDTYSQDKVLVMYACCSGKTTTYHFYEGTDSHARFQGLFLQREGLAVEPGSPFGIVLKTRLRDNVSSYALHNAIRLIIQDTNHINLRVEAKNIQHLESILPAFVRIPKALRQRETVQVAIFLLTKVPYTDMFKNNFDEEHKAIRKDLAVGVKRFRHGKCSLTKMQACPEGWRRPPESLEWKLLVDYEIEAKEDKEDLKKKLESKVKRYVRKNEQMGCFFDNSISPNPENLEGMADIYLRDWPRF
ncbi:hypothetical protein AAMO2058_000359800, partial [Amorphochlora amoebiformis]